MTMQIQHNNFMTAKVIGSKNCSVKFPTYKRKTEVLHFNLPFITIPDLFASLSRSLRLDLITPSYHRFHET